MRESDEVFLRQSHDERSARAVELVAEVLRRRPGVEVTVPPKRIRPRFEQRGAYRDDGDILLSGRTTGRVEVKCIFKWTGERPPRDPFWIDNISVIDRDDLDPWLAYAIVSGDGRRYCWLTQASRKHFIRQVDIYDKPVYAMPHAGVEHWREF